MSIKVEWEESTYVTYTYNGVQYNVSDDMHQQLQQNPGKLHEFFENNDADSSDVIGLPEISDTNESTEPVLPLEKWTWSAKSIYLLLKEYEERLERFRDPKTKKKDLWAEILTVFYEHKYDNVTIDLLDKKMRNMKMTYRTIKDTNKRKNSTGRVSWEYFDTFNRLFREDKTINHGATVDTLTITPCINATKRQRLSTTDKIAFQNIPTSTSEQLLSTPAPQSSSTFQTQPNCDDDFRSEPSSSHVNYKEKLRVPSSRKRFREIEELKKIRLAMEESNKIQQERNEILKQLLRK